MALVHDWLCGYRGGEAVLDRLARLVGERHQPAGLWVMVSDGRPVAPAVDALSVRTSVLQELPYAATRLRRHLLPLYPRAVADLSRSIGDEHRRAPIDLVLSTSSAAVKGVQAPPGVPHLCYCHTPPRYLWSQQDQYAAQGRLASAGLALAGPFLRRWDAATSRHVTSFIANSRHTARLIERCYGRTSTVVHPPVRTGYFTVDPARRRENFWLFAGALEPYKRPDLAIEAARLAGVKIVVAGTGSILPQLRSRYTGPGVEFLGRVPDEGLRELYRRAALLLFPQIEDFGIVAVEAQACGCPVVSRRAGGALETVIDGLTGRFFDDPDPASIARAAASLGSVQPTDCRRHAETFGEEFFDRRMASIVRDMIGIR
ncbi:MAG: glycosyltransferase [Phycisphaerales bacterium]|nr:glycosyltransferase [Phycisphaerales bacterium]